MKKKLFVFALSSLFAAVAIQSQPYGAGQGCRNANPEMRKDVHEKILPLITKQRLELDKTINEADKAEIGRLRAGLSNLRTQHLAKITEIKATDEVPSLEQRQEMRALRNQMATLMNDAEIIADRYDATITLLLEEIRPEIEKIHQENCPVGKGSGAGCPNAPQGKKHQYRGKKGPGMPPGEGYHFQRMLTPEGFLLFDPAEPFPLDEKTELPGEKMEVSVFPNPASQSTQISFELDQPARVIIYLLDSDGNEMLKVTETKADAGLFSTPFVVDELKDGLYFIQIKVGNDTSVKRLIVKH
ncbi:MAG: T9SS type A sorting domain-containing protein [Bacteroidales bacterium]|nr:T9SS type A sorting domain-containing protein [Bacteroidales bacterium]